MIRKLISTVAVLALGLCMTAGLNGCADDGTSVDASGPAERRPVKEARPAPGPGGSGVSENADAGNEGG